MNQRERLTMRAQLLATRASIDAALATMDQTEPPPCLHPLEKRQTVAESFGVDAEVKCGVCGQVLTT